MKGTKKPALIFAAITALSTASSVIAVPTVVHAEAAAESFTPVSKVAYSTAFLQSLISVVNEQEESNLGITAYYNYCKTACKGENLDSAYKAWEKALEDATIAAGWGGNADFVAGATTTFIKAMTTAYQDVMGKSASVAEDQSLTILKRAANQLFTLYAMDEEPSGSKVIPQELLPNAVVTHSIDELEALVTEFYNQLSTLIGAYTLEPEARSSAELYLNTTYASTRAGYSTLIKDLNYKWASAEKAGAVDAAYAAMAAFSLGQLDKTNATKQSTLTDFVDYNKNALDQLSGALSAAMARVAAYQTAVAELDGYANLASALPSTPFFIWSNSATTAKIRAAIAAYQENPTEENGQALAAVLEESHFGESTTPIEVTSAISRLYVLYSAAIAMGASESNEYVLTIRRAYEKGTAITPAEYQAALNAFERLRTIMQSTTTVVQTVERTVSATGSESGSASVAEPSAEPTSGDESSEEPSAVANPYSGGTVSNPAGTASGSSYGLWAIIAAIVALLGGGAWAYQNGLLGPR
ncbi:MAG: hypothetical protein Q3972_03255 [Corynebacterium sp.]|nr:hypothetical protein [Corynebacterium sp.]